jgi:hypothetical protein
MLLLRRWAQRVPCPNAVRQLAATIEKGGDRAVDKDQEDGDINHLGRHWPIQGGMPLVS